RGAIALVEAQVLVLGADRVAEARGIPLESASVPARVWIEHQLVRIESLARGGLVGTVYPEPVHRGWVCIGDIYVPDLVGVFRQLQPFELGLSLRVEQAYFYLGGVGGKEREVGSFAVPDRALGVRAALPNSSHHAPP